jgi:flavin-dependent dehydrogenase
MAIAQQLYEGLPIGKEGNVGLITYMRTDSTRVSPEAQAEVRGFIAERYGRDKLAGISETYSGRWFPFLRGIDRSGQLYFYNTVAEVDRFLPKTDFPLPLWPDKPVAMGDFAPPVIYSEAKKAQEMGATLYQGVKATGIQVRHGKVEGIPTEKGFVSSRTW